MVVVTKHPNPNPALRLGRTVIGSVIMLKTLAPFTNDQSDHRRHGLGLLAISNRLTQREISVKISRQ